MKTPNRMKEGFIYIISNPAHDGFIKVGVTENIDSRLRTYQTSDPKRAYKIEYYIFHPDCYDGEKKITEAMKPFAKSIKNEWFEIATHMAISRLEEIAEECSNYSPPVIKS